MERAPEYLNPPAIPVNPDLQAAATIQTFTGKMFDVFKPKREDIDLKDISHALSMLCRYGGHSGVFYSVAEHCVLMAEHFLHLQEYDLARYALLHDASEAYVGDLVRPLKLQMPAYVAAEQVIQYEILCKFGMPPEMPDEVKMADLRICNDERLMLLANQPWSPYIDSLPPLGVALYLWYPEEAKKNYNDMFWTLFG